MGLCRKGMEPQGPLVSTVLQVGQVQAPCDCCARTRFPASPASGALDAGGWQRPFATLENIAQILCGEIARGQLEDYSRLQSSSQPVSPVPNGKS